MQGEGIGPLQQQLDSLEDETTRLNRLNENNDKAHVATLSKLSGEKLAMKETMRAQNKGGCGAGRGGEETETSIEC